MSAFVGIDLGTTFSVVAHINQNGVAEAIPNHLDKLTTPSVVDVTQNPPVVGWEAKENQQFTDDGIYAFFKRDMGSPHALYMYKGKQYSPIDLSAMVLVYLKQCAEDHLKQPIVDAVITVPAYFNEMQRKDTMEAGRQAGLNVLQIINEPTAAALAFGVRPTTSHSKILVYDLGGGTFDVSLVEITPTELRVIGTAGDHYLGGKDWDDRILQYLSSEFEREFGTELITDELNPFMVQAENTKISLSSLPSIKVTVQANGQVGRYEFTRAQFEEQTRDLLVRTQLLVEQTLEEAHTGWANLTGVVLVGGSTKMPVVREYVQLMSGKPPMMGVDPDQAVALGAAIQASMSKEPQLAIRAGTKDRANRGIALFDVISNSLGMIAENEDRSKFINSIIIQKNQPIPSQQTRPYQLRLSRRNENKLEVYMTQAETPDPMGCKYLGKYVFSNIPNIQTKVAVIDITYAYNINGMVEVSAVERSTNQLLTLTIEPLPPDVPDRFGLPPTVEKTREHLNLYMAFDLSGSMSGEPLTEAQRAAQKFLSQVDLSSASVGVIEFSDSTQTTVKASQNARAISRGIQDLQIGRTGGGNDTDPFDEIYRLLYKANGLRYGLVLTDGVWSNQGRAVTKAKRCHEAGIEIIAVGFGGADQAFLRQISSSDELSFFTNLNELSDVFSSIAQELTEGGGQIDPESLKARRKGLRLW